MKAKQLYTISCLVVASLLSACSGSDSRSPATATGLPAPSATVPAPAVSPSPAHLETATLAPGDNPSFAPSLYPQDFADPRYLQRAAHLHQHL